LQDAAGDFEYLTVHRIHETFRIVDTHLMIREIRIVVENRGPRPAHFVLGPLHRKYTQVDLEAYDRDSLCEFIPSGKSIDFVTLYTLFKILAELRVAIKNAIPSTGRTDKEVEDIVAENLASIRNRLLKPLRELVDCKPSEAEGRLVEFRKQEFQVMMSGQTIATLKLADHLGESKEILEIVAEWYYEVVQLRTPILPNGYRLVNVRSREMTKLATPRKFYLWQKDLIVTLPFASVREKTRPPSADSSTASQPSTHIRILPPDGLGFRSAGKKMMRYLESLWELPTLFLLGAAAVASILVAARALLCFVAALVGLAATAIVVYRLISASSAGAFETDKWSSKSDEDVAFTVWKSDFAITKRNETSIDRNELVIAQRDYGLTYLVFRRCPPGIYDIRVACSLPRVHDSAPYLLSLFVWAVAYITWSAYLWGPVLDSTSLLSLYGENLKASFPSLPEFIRSLVLPMVALGASMTITSLIHYLNRTVPQRGLLSGYMTLVLVLLALAVLFPALMTISTLK
jgi:hypothetical protein